MESWWTGPGSLAGYHPQAGGLGAAENACQQHTVDHPNEQQRREEGPSSHSDIWMKLMKLSVP